MRDIHTLIIVKRFNQGFQGENLRKKSMEISE